MAKDYIADPFEEWSEPQQERWLDMVETSGSRAMAEDEELQYFFDIAMNTPRDANQFPSKHRYNTIQAIDRYMRDKYGVAFFGEGSIFDWNDWRDWYEGQAA